MARSTTAEPDVEQIVDDETETVPAAEATTAKAKKEPKPKPVFADGFVTPIEFQKALISTGRAPADFRPQVVYSYIKNVSKVNPFPVSTDEATGRPVVHLEQGLAWWDKKEELKGERKANAATKAETKAAKAAAKPAEAEGAEQATEAE
jgi:hypothetical protein